MNEKITNIGFAPDLTREEHFSNLISKANYNPKRQQPKKDSLNLSSYTVFLNKLGWKLKSVKFEKPRTLFLVFQIGDIQIDFECDLDDLISMGLQHLIIAKDFPDKKFRLKLFFTLRKKNIKNFTSLELRKFNSILSIFDKLNNIDFQDELNVFSNTKLSGLFSDEVSDKLIYDFEYIVFVIFRLIQSIGENAGSTDSKITDKILFEKVIKEKI